MKKRNTIALLAALSILMTGCNFTTDPPVTDNTDVSDTYIETSVSETEQTDVTTAETGKLPSETTTSETAAETTVTDTAASETTVTSTETTTSAQTTTVTDPPATEPPETDPPRTDPPATEPPVVTTQAPVIVTPTEPSAPTIYTNKASGVLTDGNNIATVDYSNTEDGYVMAKYTGSVSLIKVQITGPNGVTQTYTLSSDGSYGSFPLTGGNGSYSIVVCENVSGTSYAVALALTFDASITHSLSPYLRPNEYVDFDYNNAAVQKASQICGANYSDLEKVDSIYSWIVDNVSYDYDRAATVKKGAVPDMNRVINNKMGICLDIAGTAVAMLRSQNIPTQMVVGYAGPQYHAWISVYITDVGWVHGDVYFDGSGWKRMDPTYAASSRSSRDILDFIANNGNYSVDYLY